MTSDTESVFAHGAVIVPDFVTPAEEERMIRFIQGDIFESHCEALVNPVNCVGVMGKGLALQLKRRFPTNFEAYRDAGAGRPHFVVNFPTKRHWRDRSRIEDIAAGLDGLAGILERHAIRSVAIPAAPALHAVRSPVPVEWRSACARANRGRA